MYAHKNGITLRKVEEEDLWQLLQLKNESWFGTHRVSLLNSAEQHKWFESILNRQDCLYLIGQTTTITTNSAVPVGIYKALSIDWINRSYDSAHDVFSNYRGKGLGFKVLEAGVDFGFEILNMNRLDTEVIETNIASMKNAFRVGFITEGTRRKAVYKFGKYLDSVFMGIIREDWLKLPRIKAYLPTCHILQPQVFLDHKFRF